MSLFYPAAQQKSLNYLTTLQTKQKIENKLSYYSNAIIRPTSVVECGLKKYLCSFQCYQVVWRQLRWSAVFTLIRRNAGTQCPVQCWNIDLKELGGQMSKCLKFCPGIEIPIFTQKRTFVDMNWGGSTPNPRQFQPWSCLGPAAAVMRVSEPQTNYLYHSE